MKRCEVQPCYLPPTDSSTRNQPLLEFLQKKLLNLACAGRIDLVASSSSGSDSMGDVDCDDEIDALGDRDDDDDDDDVDGDGDEGGDRNYDVNGID